MNEYFLWFLITGLGAVVIVVGYSLLKRFLQDRDARLQLEGKESFREFKGNVIPDQKEKTLNNDFEIEKDRLRSQNLPYL